MSTCGKCGGTGKYCYGNTATYMSRAGVVSGQAFTEDLCDKCWGSGDSNRPFRNVRDLVDRATQSAALAEALRLICRQDDSHGQLTRAERANADKALAAYEEGEVTPPEKVSADMDAAVCDCYPNHCEHGDTCWCEPTVELLDNGDKLIIHNKGH